MADTQRPDDGYAISVGALERPGGQRRSIVAGVAIVGVLAIVGVGARLLAGPTPAPSPSAVSSAVAVVPTPPTQTPTAPPPPPIALVDQPIQTDPRAGFSSLVAGRPGEIAGITASHAFIRDLDTGAMTNIDAPAGFERVSSVGALSDVALVGTLDLPGTKDVGNVAFVYDRATDTGRTIRPLDGFEGFTIRGIAGTVAYGELEHRVPCCAEGAWTLGETRPVAIDLESGSITDLTPASWRGRGLAIAVRGAAEDQLLLSAETVVDPDVFAIPAFVGAAVVHLGPGPTAMLELDSDAAGVVGIAGDFVVGGYADPQQVFAVNVSTGERQSIPPGTGASVNTCAFALPSLAAFACVEGVPFFLTRAFVLETVSRTRADIPVTVLPGQELGITAAGSGGLLAGTVIRSGSVVRAFAYDVSTGALYDLGGGNQLGFGPDLITGKWILAENGAHAWTVP